MPTIDISDSLYKQLRQEADANGTPLTSYLETVITDGATASSPTENNATNPLDILPHMVYCVDTTTHAVTYLNDAAQRFVGTTADQITYSFIEALVHPDDLDEMPVLSERWHKADDARIVERVYRVKNSDGEYRWLRIFERVLHRNPDGQPCEILGIAHDVTDTYQLHHAYQTLVENSLHGMIIFQDNRLVFANSKATDITGYAREDLHQSSLMAISHSVIGEEARQELFANVEKRLQGEPNSLTRQYQFRHKDGSLRWAEVTSTRVIYEGRPAVQVAFVDVTDRHQVQQDLHESQLLYKALLAELPNTAIMLLNHHLEYIVAEGPELPNAGYDRTELVGHTLRDVVEPEFYDVAYAPVARALTGERTSIDLEHRGNHYRTSYVPILNGEGQAEYCLIVTINISDLKQAQTKQQELIDQLQLAIETVGLGMWQQDLVAGDYVWNQQLLDMYGLSVDDLQDGTEWHPLIHPDDLETAKNGLRALSEQGDVKGIRFRMVRDGMVRHIEASGRAIRDDAGNILRLIGTNLDVTNYVETQRDLSVAQSQYEVLFNGVMNPVSVLDEQGTVLMINDHSAAVLGMPAHEIVGRNMREFFPYVDESAMAFIAKILEAGEVVYDEREMDVEGELRWFASVVQPVMSPDGDRKWVQIISYDITETKQSEALMRERELLANRLARQEALTEQRSQMLSVLSHEFRTPMAIMLNAATMLSTYRDKLSIDAQNEKIDRIIQQINVLTMLLDDMNSQARQNINFFDYRPADVNIRNMMDEIIEEGHVMCNPNHELTLNLLTTLDVAHFDRRLMYHALNNLLGNAIKYSPEGGKINITVDDKNDELHFSVRDTGIGIPQEDFDVLFEPFNRASNVGAIRGTGMGLSIVKDIAELHNGRVTVRSDVGQGSEFRVIIPT